MKNILIVTAALMIAFGANAQQGSFSEKDSNCCSEQKNSLETERLSSPHHFTMNMGYGFSLSGNHDALFVNYNFDNSHKNKMRHGINFEFDYDYNFHSNMAFGGFFSMYNSYDSYYANNISTSSCSDNRWIFYVAPSFLVHTDRIAEHWNFFARATVGLMNFRNSQRALNSTLTDVNSNTFKRYTIGYSLQMGASYYINKYFSIDGSIGYLGGRVSKVKDNTQKYELSTNETLSRINVNVGVKIKL